MANFYRDNDDIQFLLKHMDLGKLAQIREENFRFSSHFDYTPADAEEAIRNYDMVLDSLGQLAGDFIAPRAEDVDRQGNTLNENGSVTRPKGIQESLEKLARAEVMGFTLPHRFGGLNFPNVIYSIAIEIVSRADAALMNIFGLQGIADTIDAFASEEIKQKYLPDFAAGRVTGAMVLTEPDAGSDLQRVMLRAFQDGNSQWYLHGVKRFITNGCGDVLLVLARSEPDITDGRGLSLFVCDRGPTVHIRRLEDKLGIHGSPTCEIFFDNTPCEIIGERQRGLITYVMSLMNGARIGIAAPLEAGRALLYETSRVVDMEIGYAKQIEANPPQDKVEAKQLKSDARKYRRLAGMLTPMSKYYCSEMCNKVAYDSIQVLGGSGYMRDYACERHARDARITTIYEGTSQLQIVAAVRGVCSGTAENLMSQYAQQEFDPELNDLLEKLVEGTEQLKKAIAFVKEHGTEYMDLYGRALVDIAIDLINGYLLCSQASSNVDMEVAGGNTQKISMKTRKAATARRYITKNAPKIASRVETICSGDKSTFTDYEALVGPVPAE